MADTPMISLWCGVPINEMPREELEQAFIDVNIQLQKTKDENCVRSIDFIRNMASVARMMR